MKNTYAIRPVVIALPVLAAFLLFLPPLAARAALPLVLETGRFDWVCVTDAPLVDAYAPLAAHRAAQGLSTLVLSLEEVIRWSPAGDDTTATLRWLAGVAHGQWGARYLLLGGSHALLPAPIHRLSFLDNDNDHPTDAYYACLDGDWDVDGDGLVAEWEDDAADPAVQLGVGRLPADDPQAVSDVVAKIIAFEKRPAAQSPGALFVSSLLDATWDGTGPYPNTPLGFAMSLRDQALAASPTLRAGTLFQGPEVVPPLEDPLNPVALADSLGSRAHDLVFFQLNGSARTWELAGGLNVHEELFAPLADSGRLFLTTMLSGPVADTRGPCILRELIAMRGGGSVGVIAPSGLAYFAPLQYFQQRLWDRLLDGGAERLGDAFDAALADIVGEGGFANSAAATTYWYQTLLGDPALLLRPLDDPTSGVPPTASPARLRAVPNPFNPETVIEFEVAGGDGGLQPVTVEIFDLQGRRVARLLERALLPGPHAVSWRAAGPSGLYFARVTVADTDATVKLTLVE